MHLIDKLVTTCTPVDYISYPYLLDINVTFAQRTVIVVPENKSSLAVCIAILGVLERETSVSIATNSITAVGKFIASLSVLLIKITYCKCRLAKCFVSGCHTVGGNWGPNPPPPPQKTIISPSEALTLKKKNWGDKPPQPPPQRDGGISPSRHCWRFVLQTHKKIPPHPHTHL